jgi:hypothetical protein
MTSRCFVCHNALKMGQGRYEGRVIQGWGREVVCDRCREVDGIDPDRHRHLVPALHKRGIQVQYNERGFILIPT